MGKYYLAYGSNLNINQMAFRCPGAVPIGTARIDDYELVFRRGYLTIEPKKGSFVPVGVWKITLEDEKSLDHYEGFPKFYVKKQFDLNVNGKRRKNCMAYVMTEGFQIQAPSTSYFYTVYHGYSEFDIADKTPLIRAYRYAKWGEEVDE